MSKRKYNVDDYFFDEINNQERAYILGLFYADGCNYENGVVKIDLAEQDYNYLLKIKDILNYTGEIKKYGEGKKKFTGYDKLYNCQDICRLSMRSKHMSDQLAEKGCIHNKTYSLLFPTENILPKELIRHFIRGYMDGDGGISYWIDNKNTGHKKFSNSFLWNN